VQQRRSSGAQAPPVGTSDKAAGGNLLGKSRSMFSEYSSGAAAAAAAVAVHSRLMNT